MATPLSYDVAAFNALQKLVGTQPRRFSLNMAVCSDASLRATLAQQLMAAWSNIEVVSFWPYSEDVFEHVHETLDEGPRDAIFIYGLDDAVASSADPVSLYHKLNVSPERWKAWFACPIIFWVDKPSEETLRDEAKDFWEWLTGHFRLDKVPEL